LDEKGWAAVNQALDVTLYTIAEVCPKESNFVITSEMLADNPYHKNYFERVKHAATKRAATLTPVRLVCELDELLNRVQNNSRLAYFKTRDVDLIKKRFAEEKVFFSQMPNELTLDVTNLTPKESAAKILEWVAGDNKKI
jgi:aminoglycoside 6'-N-acetyltransferase